MRLLLQPDHASQEERHFASAAAALRYYGDGSARIPYDHVTIVDPAFQSAPDGMEYPTLFTAGTRWIAPTRAINARGSDDSRSRPSMVVRHRRQQRVRECVDGRRDQHVLRRAHRRSRVRRSQLSRAPRYFGGFIPWVFHDIKVKREWDEGLAAYRREAESDAEATPSFRYWPSTGGNITYFKTALWLHTLERSLGWPTLQRAMSSYFERWKFRHPQPADFFQAISDAAGRDMTPFFDQIYRGSNAFDYGVQQLTSAPAGAGRFRTTVVARRFGEATFPVDVVTTFGDGSKKTERWDGVERRAMYVYDTKARARSVEVDPNRILLLDVNYTNNSRTLQPRAGEASRKWSLKWMAWLQDTLLTYGWLF